jgi:adenylate cyclase
MRAGRYFARTIRPRAARLIALGTRGYPPKIRRRLQSTNVGSYTIAISCGLFALTYALEDASLYRGAVLINLAMMVAAASVPLFHRINDLAGAIFIGTALLVGLFLLVALVGRLSGIQINFIAASAAAFLVFDLRRLWHIVILIGSAIALHLMAWVLFPEAMLPDMREGFVLQIYITIVITISVIVAVLVYYAFRTAEIAEAATEALLGRILPASVVERLKERPDEQIADSIPIVAVLFSDLVGFVPLSRGLGAARTVEMLNSMVQSFDRLAAEHRIEKIKTIGDAYMAVAGLPQPAADDAARLARMALRMQSAVAAAGADFGVKLRLRIGIAAGPAMAGIIGSEKFSYDVWGDSVNLAARLESSGEAERIQVSGVVRDLLAEKFEFAHRGSIEIKGVGPQETYFLLREKCDEGPPATIE